jgi:hypothetical protein
MNQQGDDREREKQGFELRFERKLSYYPSSFSPENDALHGFESAVAHVSCVVRPI